MIAVYSNWCSAFKLVQCVQTGAVRSNLCSAFKLVQCQQNNNICMCVVVVLECHVYAIM